MNAPYSIGADPYLSTETKQMLARHKAEGIDTSLVESFLAETAPLMKPAQPPKLLAAYVAIVCAIVAVAVVGAAAELGTFTMPSGSATPVVVCRWGCW